MTPLEFIQQARWLGAKRGYKSSWPYVVFHVQFGEWPGRLLKEGQPQEATPEFLDWVNSYQKINTQK
jgi:hypothetical protein